MKKLTLASSTFCAPCNIVKRYIEENQIEVTKKDMNDDIEFFIEHKIKSIPTLVIENGDETQYLFGIDDILKYFKSEQ